MRFIIFCISWNCLRSCVDLAGRGAAAVGDAQPARAVDELGLARSSSVIERMIASTRLELVVVDLGVA